jgi:hypothetical protein
MSLAAARTLDLITPLVAARRGGWGMPLHTLPVSGPGWYPGLRAAEDAELRTLLLARSSRAAGLASPAVAVTWHLEKHAWFMGAVAVAGLVVHGAMPPLERAAVRYGDAGWVEAVALPPDGWLAASGEELAARLEAHFRPLVEALAVHRPRRALWRSVGDRLGQAAQWCGEAFGDRDAAWGLAAEVLEAPGALRAHAGFELRDGEPYRRRAGCCLSHRTPPAITCVDCRLVR